MVEELLSVGIDIGTTTTQVVFSKIKLEDRASYFAIPQISIVNKEVIYKSKSYFTPLESGYLIDGDKIKEIVACEYKLAAISPSEIKIGAIIITGESAQKENAALILSKLSDLAGDFVVSTAGPDIEAVIAGKGSGAKLISENENCIVANMDIGGGTTNIVLFDKGEVIGKTCLDIGGRLIKVDESANKITYVSDSVKKICTYIGVSLAEGDDIDENILWAITSKMANLIEQSLGIAKKDALFSQIKTKNSSQMNVPSNLKILCFSGGVADGMYENKNERFAYGDIGILLGNTLSEEIYFQDIKKSKGNETIRATVVGAGMYTSTISGSTITFTEDIFPIKNIPVLRLSEIEECLCYQENSNKLFEKLKWFSQQSSTENIVLSLKGKRNPSYKEVKSLGKNISKAWEMAFFKAVPLVLVLEEDIGKALGKAIYESLDEKRAVICLDCIKAEENDYIDMGKPIMNGSVIPVVVKTLIFS